MQDKEENHKKRPKGITKIEFIEMNSNEIKKFKHLQPITGADIDNVNWEELSKKLVEA